MKTLFNEINQFADEVVLFTEELEDHFGSPDLREKLKYFRDQLKKLKSYEPMAMGDSEAERNENEAALYDIQLGCEKALDSLSEVTAKSNVFDIIDALRGVYTAITHAIPDCNPSYDPFEYDPDDAMEAERASKVMSRVLFDDEDETEYLSYDRGISAKGEDWHEDNC